MRSLNRYWRDECGAGAAEFALVLIPFLALIFGIIGLSLMLYANQTLHYAVESAARCASVQSTTTCDTPGHIQAYATARYSGPLITPVFTYTAGGCGPSGHTVGVTATYPLRTGLVNVDVPLGATACFP
jgi:Flp pilus assembly pilin Flp